MLIINKVYCQEENDSLLSVSLKLRMEDSKSGLPLPPCSGSLRCDLTAFSRREALGSSGASHFAALLPRSLCFTVLCVGVIPPHTGGVGFGEELIEDFLGSFYRVGHAHRLACGRGDARESSRSATQLYHTTVNRASY